MSFKDWLSPPPEKVKLLPPPEGHRPRLERRMRVMEMAQADDRRRSGGEAKKIEELQRWHQSAEDRIKYLEVIVETITRHE